MKKKLSILLAVALVLICSIAILAISATAEEREITISYIKSQDTTSVTTTLDAVAYENGKQTVKAGEEFTLPLAADNSYVGKDGFQLIWYTEDGRTYKAGEAVSFDKDTKLFRCVAKEVYTIAELNVAMTSGSNAAILMTDITTTVGIEVKDQDMSALILNGYTINMTRNGDIIGNQRSGKQILGEGTVNVSSTDGKVGAYYVINSQGHGYNGTKNRSVIGRDVTINAPDFWLTEDWDGTNAHHPWIRIYGKIDVYGLMVTSTGPTRTQLFEIFENAVVKINGPELYKCNNKSTNTQYYFNNHAIQTRIYGGTFYLPAEAENLSFWSDEYKTEYVNGNITYSPREVTDANRDSIKISGGSFVLPDNKTPAIASFLTEDFVSMMHDGGNGLVTNNNTSTYYVPFHNKGYYKLTFDKYTSPTPAKLTVTDFYGNSTEYRYTITKTADGAAIESITVYEASVKDNGDGTTTTVYETVTDDFTVVQGANFFEFKNATTSKDYKLQNLEANNTIYQVVVPADCEHTFTGEAVEATCAHNAHADYNCSKCGYNVYFSWGEKGNHAYELKESIVPTASSHGSKTFICSMCGDSRTYSCTLDPTNMEVAVTIRNDDGTFEEITALASEVFEFSTTGGLDTYIYTLSGIKAFGDYSIRNIYGVVIPKGIMYVNIATQNLEKYENADYGLEVVEIATDSTIVIQNIGNLSCLKTLKAGENSSITIEPSASWYSPNNEKRSTSKLTTVDFSAGNITVKVMNSAFQDRPIKELKLGENSSYSFEYQSFRNTQVTELIIPTTSTVYFGSLAFYSADLTSISFPAGTAENLKTWIIESECFRNNPITEIEFGEYATYTLGSSSFNNTKVEAIKLAPNSTYTINSWSFSTTPITSFDASAGNITLTVNGSGLRDLIGITEFKLGENSTYYFAKESLGKTAYTSLILPKNSTYTFVEYFMSGNTVFKELDASAEGITVNFKANCFNGISTLDKITLGKNSTYSFEGDSLKGTAVTELIFKEGTTANFYGNAFRNSSLTSGIVLAENGNYTFHNSSLNYALFEELTLPANGTYLFKDWVFNTGSSIKVLDASADNINVTFNGSSVRNSSAITTVLLNGNNSTYVIHSEAFRNLANLSIVAFNGENSSYTLNNSNTFIECPQFKELTLGKNSTYKFGQGVIGDKTGLEKLDASAEGVNVEFVSSSFRNASALTTVLLNGNNSTYLIQSEAFKNLASLSTFALNGENSSYTINNSNALADCPKLKELTFGKNSTYKFGQWIVGGTTRLEKLDASADGITVEFGQNSFRGQGAMTELLINGKNSTYTFVGESFRGTGVRGFTLGEGSTYDFKQNSFLEANSIEKFDASANNVTLTVGNHLFNGKTALVSLDISGEGSTYTFGQEAFRNTKITELKTGSNSTYSLGYLCFYSSTALETIDFTSGNTTVTLANQVFDASNLVSYIAFGENSTYTIGDYAFKSTAPTNDIVFSNTSTFKIGREAFRYADFASITFEDNLDITFTGVEAFRECDKAKTLYIGRNIAITNYPFKHLKALETLYIMEGVTHASEWEFEYAGSGDYSTPLYVYNHSLDFVFNKGLFNECDGIFVYTITDNIGTSGEVFRACGDTNGFKGWTVYLGLAHPLTNYHVDPDCVNNGYETWIADSSVCPCGSLTYFTETTVINKYEKKHNITADTVVDEAVTFTVTPVAPLGHDKLGEKTNIAYVSYLEKGSVSYICTRCNVEHTVENDAEALFVFLGYSMPENGKLQLSIGYIVNKDAIAEYEKLANTTVNYGVVCAVANQLNGKAPLDETLDGVKVINVEISKSYSAFDFVLSGFNNDLLDLELVMAAYAVEGDSIVYLQYTQTDNPSSYSISQYLIDNSKAPTDSLQQ